jgi:pyrimidine-nucleoside phosphorylase
MLREMTLPVTLIARKRDRQRHEDADIAELIDGYMSDQITDYQMSAWLMAAWLNGLDKQETWALTHAMLHSGKVLDLTSVPHPRIDKHSTGGVGDKLSLPLAPLVACCGVRVPMISGRGLGHTGGTLDKLESIPGYEVRLSVRQFEKTLRTVGASIIGQTAEVAPADRRIYSLRDVTATVESIPLITASILSKKLAAGVDGLVFDVKVGSGAFMAKLGDARKLARSLVDVSKKSGKRAVALLTDMSAPSGRMIGNALEVQEAIDLLNNAGPTDSRELTLRLGIEMLLLGGAARTAAQARAMLEKALTSGEALERFERMIHAHGGDVRCVADPKRLPRTKARVPVIADRSGWVTACNPRTLAWAALEMGAGRTRADQSIDPAVGIELAVQRGERAQAGQPLAYLHVHDKQSARKFVSRVHESFTVSRSRPAPTKLILGRVT